MIDITAQKKLEESKKEFEDKYSNIFHSSPVAYSIFSMDGHLVEANQAFLNFTGNTYESALGKTTLELNLISAIDQQRMRETIINSRGNFDNFELESISRDGISRFMLISHRSITINSVPHSLSVAIDITELKYYEKKLKESEEKFAKLFQNAPVILTLFDLDNFVNLDVNEEAIKVSGYSRDEIVGSDGRQLNWITQQDRNKLLDELRVKGHIYEQEVTFHSKDGKKIIVLIKGEPVTFSGRNCLLTAAVDITERKLIEIALDENRAQLKIQNQEYQTLNDELKRAKENLEKSQHNLQLKNKEYECLNEELKQANEELIKAKLKAEENDNLKTAFLQNMSHEVRTPLNAIYGFSKMLEKPNLPIEKRTNFTSIIINSSNQLLSILNDILTISSIDTKQEKVNLSNVCVNSIFKDLLIIFKSQIINKDITINIKKELTDKQSEIETDKTKMIQILTNLMTNALKFTQHGFVEFGYSILGANGNSSPQLQFYVKDTGIGIDPALQNLIFDRFRQADKSIQLNYGGTGLGLAISKAFVELLGGKIWVESEPEKGSTFYFTVPYKPVNV